MFGVPSSLGGATSQKHFRRESWVQSGSVLRISSISLGCSLRAVICSSIRYVPLLSFAALPQPRLGDLEVSCQPPNLASDVSERH